MLAIPVPSHPFAAALASVERSPHRRPGGFIERARKPTARDRRRWAHYLVDERAEAQVYRELAARRDGEEREILPALADAEGRHEAHWLALLGGEPPACRVRILGRSCSAGWRSDSGRSSCSPSPRTPRGAPLRDRAVRNADHGGRREDPSRGRTRSCGARTSPPVGHVPCRRLRCQRRTGLQPRFGHGHRRDRRRAAVRAVQRNRGAARRCAVDGRGRVRVGALAARAARCDRTERLRRRGASRSRPRRQRARSRLPHARHAAAARLWSGLGAWSSAAQDGSPRRAGRWMPRQTTRSSAARGAPRVSSFLFFASGAIIPVLPWIFGLSGLAAVVTALVLVGIALMATGAMVGLLSGGPPLRRALRQLLIGYGAAAVTYCGWVGCSGCRSADRPTFLAGGPDVIMSIFGWRQPHPCAGGGIGRRASLRC